MDPYFRRAKPDEVVAILRAREPARILIANGNKKDDLWHLQLAQRWVIQYNFYIHDARWGRMFVRVCPYFPFSARVCLNQHHWLANRMREEGIHFHQCSNAFSMCSNAKRLQELSDSLSASDLLTCGQKWLACCTPFFTEHERKHAGCQHRLFFAQVEYCDNLIFERRAALDALGERLLDANRTIGQPNKITTIFGRKVTKRYGGKLQTVIEDLDLPNPVIRSHYGNGFIKQYVRDHLNLRTEPATNDVTDYGVKKAIENLPQLREKMSSIVDRYHDVQQDILETFVDRGQLRKLAEPTVLPSGKRIPGLKLAQGGRLAKAQIFRLHLHGLYAPHTSMALLHEFGECRTPHAVARRRRRDDRQLQRLRRLGEGHHVVFQLAGRTVADARHQADLVIDEDKRSVLGSQRLVT